MCRGCQNCCHGLGKTPKPACPPPSPQAYRQKQVRRVPQGAVSHKGFDRKHIQRRPGDHPTRQGVGQILLDDQLPPRGIYNHRMALHSEQSFGIEKTSRLGGCRGVQTDADDSCPRPDRSRSRWPEGGELHNGDIGTGHGRCDIFGRSALKRLKISTCCSLFLRQIGKGIVRDTDAAHKETP